MPVLVALPTIMSNLDTGGGPAQFVKVTAQLQIARGGDEAAVRAKMPQIQDVFQAYLHETRPEELSGAGLYRLREAMFRQVGNVVAPVVVTDLLFVELLTQ